MHRLIKAVCAIAAEEIGMEKAGRIAAAAQKRYEELCTENVSDSKALRAHTYRRIYPEIAVYEAMRAEEIESENAVGYLREYFRRYTERIVPHLQRILRIPGLARRIPSLFTKMSIAGFSPDAGFTYEFPERQKNEARFNIVRCPYFEACRRYGCTEIVRAFCDSDDTAYGHLHPRLIWGRTKTIGRGGDCCDFRLTYEEKGSILKKTSVQTEGFESILYPGNGRKDKVLIVMSGSDGGMRLTKQESEFYHRNGIPALALALFKTKQTPKELSLVPVEYVERAVSWLKQQGYRQIGIDGTSKGSEMALVAASLFPELSCVIVRVPSHFVSEGLSGSGKDKAPSGTSCWSYHGKPLPYAPYRSRSFNILGMFLKEKEMHIITFNRDKEVTPETLIPITKIRAPILMLSSRHDEVWPSFESASLMEKELTEAAFPYPHKHVAYEHMSHAVVTKLPLIYKLAFKSERRNPEGCAADRAALKQELLEWVNRVW